MAGLDRPSAVDEARVSSMSPLHAALQSLYSSHHGNPKEQQPRREAGRKGRPRLSDRRVGLHFPRLSRAAAAHAPLRRAAGRRRARLLRHVVEAVARDAASSTPPTHFAAIFDLSEQTFRNDLFADYKANRPEPPDDLIPQFPLIRDAVHAFNVACIEKEGYEADDLIATYAREAVEAGAEVTIVSSDKDLMQLVRPGVRMYDTMKNKMIGEAEVIERFGVPPSKVVEVQALIGDSTDNVPGVPGIGVKTAALLINEFGDLETLLARASRSSRTSGARASSLSPTRHGCRRRWSSSIRMCRSTSPLAETAVHAARRRGAHRLHAQARIHHAAPPRGRGPRRRVCPKA